MDKIPEDRDARLAFLEGWVKSQQSRLALMQPVRLASDEQRRWRAEEIAHGTQARQRIGQSVKVYVPFTEFAPGVEEALQATGHPVTVVYVGARDDAYWELLNGLWSKGQSFIVVEHDIVVSADTFEELENCHTTGAVSAHRTFLASITGWGV